MRQKILITTLVAIAVISVGGFYELNLVQTQNQIQTYNPGFVPQDDPLLKTLAGEKVNDLQEAKLKSGFAKLEPTYLPPGYQIRQIQNIADDNRVGMLISKSPITDKTTIVDYTWKQGGLGLEVSKLPDNFDKSRQIKALVSEGSTYRVIDGKEFVFHDIINSVGPDGQTVSAPAELGMYDGQIVTRISGFISPDEMIKIAQSIK